MKKVKEYAQTIAEEIAEETKSTNINNNELTKKIAESIRSWDPEPLRNYLKTLDSYADHSKYLDDIINRVTFIGLSLTNGEVNASAEFENSRQGRPIQQPTTGDAPAEGLGGGESKGDEPAEGLGGGEESKIYLFKVDYSERVFALVKRDIDSHPRCYYRSTSSSMRPHCIYDIKDAQGIWLGCDGVADLDPQTTTRKVNKRTGIMDNVTIEAEDKAEFENNIAEAWGLSATENNDTLFNGLYNWIGKLEKTESPSSHASRDDNEAKRQFIVNGYFKGIQDYADAVVSVQLAIIDGSVDKIYPEEVQIFSQLRKDAKLNPLNIMGYSQNSIYIENPGNIDGFNIDNIIKRGVTIAQPKQPKQRIAACDGGEGKEDAPAGGLGGGEAQQGIDIHKTIRLHQGNDQTL